MDIELLFTTNAEMILVLGVFLIVQVAIVITIRQTFKRMHQMIKNTLAVTVGYSVEGSEIVFTTAPAKGATVSVSYEKERS